MSTYSQTYSNPFIHQSRGKKPEPDPNEELICNNCINQSLIDAKKNREKETKNQETPMDIQDRLNGLARKQIFNKVQERIKMSEQVAKKLRTQSVEKERLIKENEKGTFFLNDPDVLCNDYQKKRALDNYNRKLKCSSSTAKMTEKPEVEKYYRKYVDNYKEPETQPLKSRKSLVKNYNEELENQIITNQKLRNRKKKEDDDRVLKEQQKDNENFIKEQNELARKKQQMNEDFIRGNRNLMYLKNKKQQNEKLQNNYNDQNNISQLQKQLEEEEKQRRDQENEKKRKLQQDLERQVKENQRKKQLEKNDKFVPRNPFGECTCQGTGVCCSCKKTYPLSFLNPRRNYASLAQRRFIKKTSGNVKY